MLALTYHPTPPPAAPPTHPPLPSLPSPRPPHRECPPRCLGRRCHASVHGQRGAERADWNVERGREETGLGIRAGESIFVTFVVIL